MWNPEAVDALKDGLARAVGIEVHGRVAACRGNLVSAEGLGGFAGVGDPCRIRLRPGDGGEVAAEVVGFAGDTAYLMPYEEIAGMRPGTDLRLDPGFGELRPDRTWRGRVIDAFGDPIDGKGPLPCGARAYPIQGRPVPAQRRRLVERRLHLGVRALDLFTPCCHGQRLGIFAGSGVGKSSLMAMLAARSDADVLVVGLIGERGRELNEFLRHTLGEAGLARSVVVVATSDMPAMMRRRAAYMTLTVAEHLRDEGLNVLCLMDSVTRFALALREIHLAAGEPPTTRGYPPSVFAELPRLLERAGPGEGLGTITGLFTVLVEGDDTNEPVSDTVRGILDGHVIMDRRIAEAGRYPAIDVLRSVSRTAPGCYASDEWPVVQRARRLLQAHEENKDLVTLGAYKRGANALLDEAIRLKPEIEDLLAQRLDEPRNADDDPFAALAAVLAMRAPI
ncbi:MAG: flagellar protein export ATPase FliI [Geminicoccaceae bacterium]|nr:flagellar protein export ATPase FliI [Geminicoccaceae bacterium]